MANDQLFFVGLKAFIEKDGAVLVMSDPKGRLDFPGGKIQEGEDDFALAFKREVLEETGFDVEIRAPFYSWHFNLPPEHKNAGKKVFLIAFVCNWISGDLVEADSHNNYRWVTKENYKEVDDGSGHFIALAQYFKNV